MAASVPIYGVDVSHWRGAVDWGRARQAGIRFGFAKATEGTGFTDPRWKANRAGMLALDGFVPGAYHFLRGDADVRQQVKHFLNQAGDVSRLAVALDVETRQGAARQATAGDARAWVAEFKRATGGHPVIGYYPRWYWDRTGKPNLSFFDTLWASRYVNGSGTPAQLYPKVPADWWATYGGEPVSILQFSASGSAPGVPPPVDLNAYRGSVVELRTTALGGPMVDIVSRAEWGARTPRSRISTTWPRRTEFVVHYSAGPTSQTVKQIQNFHMDSRGWSDIAYNFLVDRTGRIYEGRGWLVIGSHATGHNTSGIGVCFIGHDSDATEAAKESIRWLAGEADRLAGRRLTRRGHGQLSGQSTACPGRQLLNWVNAGMPITEEDDMPLNDADKKWIRDAIEDTVRRVVYEEDSLPAPNSNPDDPFAPKSNPGFDPERNTTWAGKSYPKQTVQGLIVVDGKLDGIDEKLDGLAGTGGGVVDADALAAKVADLLAARLES